MYLLSIMGLMLHSCTNAYVWCFSSEYDASRWSASSFPNHIALMWPMEALGLHLRWGWWKGRVSRNRIAAQKCKRDLNSLDWSMFAWVDFWLPPFPCNCALWRCSYQSIDWLIGLPDTVDRTEHQRRGSVVLSTNWILIFAFVADYKIMILH